MGRKVDEWIRRINLIVNEQRSSVFSRKVIRNMRTRPNRLDVLI